jgi:hypothetical protein
MLYDILALFYTVMTVLCLCFYVCLLLCVLCLVSCFVCLAFYFVCSVFLYFFVYLSPYVYSCFLSFYLCTSVRTWKTNKKKENNYIHKDTTKNISWGVTAAGA